MEAQKSEQRKHIEAINRERNLEMAYDGVLDAAAYLGGVQDILNREGLGREYADAMNAVMTLRQKVLDGLRKGVNR
jgi:hypothetical protein